MSYESVSGLVSVISKLSFTPLSPTVLINSAVPTSPSSYSSFVIPNGGVLSP